MDYPSNMLFDFSECCCRLGMKFKVKKSKLFNPLSIFFTMYLFYILILVASGSDMCSALSIYCIRWDNL